ncbi:caspase domain-containing protein [Mycena leptocephala]|nr:caspase domain-containing protein [Mycena leptocephala]
MSRPTGNPSIHNPGYWTNDGYVNTEELRTLRGAVNDARAVENYLLNLDVPPSNIVLLENENATRSAILSAFRTHLLENTNIPDHGEATMIFFFAGHGSRFEAPSDLIAPDRMVEAICPVDERTVNDVGEYVHAIPDYVLVRLFSELADKKGNNITVILDCCHSGGMERDVAGTRDARTARSDSYSIPLDIDSHFWKGKNDTVQSYRMWAKSSSSHVLLAACRAGETAREVQYPDGTYHGRFTTHLVSLLEQTPLESATFVELLNRIQKWSGQTPYCGGTRSNRLIFNRNYPAAGRRSALLTPQKSPRFKSASSSQLFRVEMGTVEGVVSGTEFSAYDPKNNYLCTFIAHSVWVGETTLVWKQEKDQPPVDIPPWSRAVVADWKSTPLLVHAPTDFPHMSVLFPTTGTVRPPNFVSAPSLEEAHIVVRSDGGEIVIEPRTSTVLAGLPKPRLAFGDPAHLPHIIDGVAHFAYFLGCANEGDRLEGVELEMHRLRGEYPCCTPDPQIGNMIEDGAVRVMSEVDAQYGFTIRNMSEENLFPYLFYFDPGTYTIQNWYSPAAAGVEPPLPSGGTATIGMGSERAFDFTLSPGELSSCGFLKLFVTSDYIDLGWIQQELSPFEPGFEGTGRLRMLHEPLDLTTMSDAMLTTAQAVTGAIPQEEVGCLWDALTIPSSSAPFRSHLTHQGDPRAAYAHEVEQLRFALMPLLRALQFPDSQICANAIDALLAASATGTHVGVLAEHAPALVRTLLGRPRRQLCLSRLGPWYDEYFRCIFLACSASESLRLCTIDPP